MEDNGQEKILQNIDLGLWWAMYKRVFLKEKNRVQKKEIAHH